MLLETTGCETDILTVVEIRTWEEWPGGGSGCVWKQKLKQKGLMMEKLYALHVESCKP
jgi:hypothetical protein